MNHSSISQAKPSQAKPSHSGLNYRTLVAALLALFSVLNAGTTSAAAPAEPALAIRPSLRGIAVEVHFDPKKVILAPEYGNVTGASLYELWNASRRIASGQVIGLQEKVAFALLDGSPSNNVIFS